MQPTQPLVQSGASQPPLQVPAGPSRLQRSLAVLSHPLQWVKTKFGPGPRDEKLGPVLGNCKTIISDYLGYGGEGDRAHWHQAALTGRVSPSQAPEVPVNDPLRLPLFGVKFLHAYRDPGRQSDLGQQVFLMLYEERNTPGKDKTGGYATGRSLGWGQTYDYRVNLAVVVRALDRTHVKPDAKHMYAWDDGETVEYRLGVQDGDETVSPSAGVGPKLEPVRLTEERLLDGVAKHRSVLVRLGPYSAPAMVVLQARATDGQWIVRRPTSDSVRATTGQMWTMLTLPQDTEMMFNPYDNVDRAEHRQRWHGAAPGDTLYVEGYPVTCLRPPRKSDDERPGADLLRVFCADSQGNDAHRRLALLQEASGVSEPAEPAEESNPVLDQKHGPAGRHPDQPIGGAGPTGGRVYKIAIGATVKATV